ncbi:MAG: SEC-C domain-containing protein, partial [Alphaproteobacteria bacterium]|nr:SEC-C domain-containing protein [Alphaproteobacteria bacterium]
VIDVLVKLHIPERAYAEQWNVSELKKGVQAYLNLDLPIEEWASEEGIAEDDIHTRIVEAADKLARERAERFGPEVMTYVEKSVVLQTLDHLWREHLVNLDHLRSVVGFRGYAQRDPLQEYKSEAFELFQALLANLRQAVMAQLMRVELVRETAPEPELPESMEGHHIDATTGDDEFAQSEAQMAAGIVAPEDRDPEDESTWGKVGRNEACPCGSGKKYKHCHGAIETQKV